MLQQLLVAALGLSVFLAEAEKPNPNQCLTDQSLRATLSRQAPMAEQTFLSGDAAQAFVAAFNTVPPHTNVVAETVLLVTLDNAPGAILLFFRHSCLTGRATMPATSLEPLLRSIEQGA